MVAGARGEGSGVAKRTSVAGWAGNIESIQLSLLIIESTTHKTGGGYWTCSDKFSPIPYWRNCTFT